jgi:hypothetical protein
MVVVVETVSQISSVLLMLIIGSAFERGMRATSKTAHPEFAGS